MKKGQNHKALSPQKTMAQNAEVAWYGLLAETDIARAWDALHVLTGDSRWRDNAARGQIGHYINSLPADVRNFLWLHITALSYFAAAFEKNDARFFEGLAKLAGMPKDESGMPCASWDRAAAIAIYQIQKMKAADGSCSPEMTTEEMKQALGNVLPSTAVDDSTFSRIVKETGMELKKGKPGPQPGKEKTSGVRQRR